jgi:AraC-like DNA-binding protein
LLKTILPFSGLLERIAAAGEPRAIADLFDSVLLAALDAHPLTADEADEEKRIIAAHAALIDPVTSTVAEMTDRLGMTIKQLHRFSLKIFGFPPKQLIRRQRFLRTMAAVIHSPATNWADALDLQYYDQPHFNRDFREFFGMSPDQYRRLPHPVIGAAAKARMKALGDPLQALQRPGSAAGLDNGAPA